MLYFVERLIYHKNVHGLAGNFWNKTTQIWKYTYIYIWKYDSNTDLFCTGFVAEVNVSIKGLWSIAYNLKDYGSVQLMFLKHFFQLNVFSDLLLPQLHVLSEICEERMVILYFRCP